MRVLLVDDTPALVRALRQGLEESGFAVEVAPDGNVADAKCKSTLYDVIILDVGLPQQDGLTLLKKWRSRGITTHVMMLSARATVQDRVTALDSGADDYLAKPFAFEELLSRIRALVRRGHIQKNPEIRVADLVIDTAARRVGRAGQIIRLTPREYGLLEFLANHRGRVVTRTMIWEHLYDEHDESTSNVVDVYIRYLRNKIDRGFSSPLILTKWGEGYMLSDDDPRTGSTGRARPADRRTSMC